MIRTLLFDLDNTLLDNEMGTFVPAYLGMFSEHTAGRLKPDVFTRELLAGTRVMSENDDPARSLRDAFEDVFYPAVGIPEPAFRDEIESFYTQRYPALAAVVERRAAAREVMEWAFGADFEVVIATNPLFPLTALQQRLDWAGVGDYPYALITSSERMHFAKPRPAYFAEILAVLGRRPEEALVIGNDWRNDIRAAHAAGIPAYWIASPADRPPDGNVAGLVGQGDLSDFLQWARDDDCVQRVVPPPTGSRALLAQLLAMPAAAHDAVRELPDRLWGARPAPDEWSLVEVVCHLRDSERDVNQPRVSRILTEERPFLSAVNPDEWVDVRAYGDADGSAALDEYVAARKATYAQLAQLSPEAWGREARHAIFGPTTLAEVVSIWLDHDRVHVAQLRATRARVEADPTAG